jgi:hypothetical protein
MREHAILSTFLSCPEAVTTGVAVGYAKTMVSASGSPSQFHHALCNEIRAPQNAQEILSLSWI